MHASSHSRWAPHLYFLVKQRVPCSRVGRRGGSFPVLALYSVLFITSEWLLFVPFYFTLIIPTLIASSSRIFFPRLHFRTLISSLSLSQLYYNLQRTDLFVAVHTVEFVWVLVFWISIYVVTLGMDKSQVT